MTTFAASVTIVDLPVGTTVTGAELFEAVQTSNNVGQSVQLSLTQMMTLGGLPTGGATGTILNKSSGSNYSTQFSNITNFVAVGTALATTGSATSIVAYVPNQAILSTQIANNAVGTNQIASSLGIASTLSVGTNLNVLGTATIAGIETVTGTATFNGGIVGNGTLNIIGVSTFTGNISAIVNGTTGFDVNYGTTNATSINSAASPIRLIGPTNGFPALLLQAYGSGFPFLGQSVASGTVSAPSPVATGSVIGAFNNSVYNGSGYSIASQIVANALNQPSATDNSGYMDFKATPSGGTSPLEVMRIQASGGVSIGTTTDPGIGKLVVNSGILVNSGTVTFTSAFNVNGTALFTSGAFGVVGTTQHTGTFNVVGTSTLTGSFFVNGTTLFTSSSFGISGGPSVFTSNLTVVGSAQYTSGTFGVNGSAQQFTSSGTFGINAATTIFTTALSVIGTTNITGAFVLGNNNTTGVLVSSGTGVVSAAGGLVLLNTLSPSAIASIADTSSITSAYRNYLIMMDTVCPATQTTTLQITLATSGTAYTTAGYVSIAQTNVSSIIVTDTTTAVWLVNGTRSTTQLQTSTVFGVSGVIKLLNPSSSTNAKTMIGQVTFPTPGAIGTTTVAQAEINGYFNNAAPVTGINFAFNSGNIATGTIRIYGLT